LLFHESMDSVNDESRLLRARATAKTVQLVYLAARRAEARIDQRNS
jgi:hypothetical protein